MKWSGEGSLAPADEPAEQPAATELAKVISILSEEQQRRTRGRRRSGRRSCRTSAHHDAGAQTVEANVLDQRVELVADDEREPLRDRMGPTCHTLSDVRHDAEPVRRS